MKKTIIAIALSGILFSSYSANIKSQPYDVIHINNHLNSDITYVMSGVYPDCLPGGNVYTIAKNNSDTYTDYLCDHNQFEFGPGDTPNYMCHDFKDISKIKTIDINKNTSGAYGIDVTNNDGSTAAYPCTKMSS